MHFSFLKCQDCVCSCLKARILKLKVKPGLDKKLEVFLNQLNVNLILIPPRLSSVQSVDLQRLAA